VRFLTSFAHRSIIITVKRRALPDLSHLLDDSRPLAAVPIVEKRIHTRFDKAFIVVIGSELYGDAVAIARNVSAGGILVEMASARRAGRARRGQAPSLSELRRRGRGGERARDRAALHRVSGCRRARRSRANSLGGSRVG
jgi:hypothetical protein